MANDYTTKTDDELLDMLDDPKTRGEVKSELKRRREIPTGTPTVEFNSGAGITVRQGFKGSISARTKNAYEGSASLSLEMAVLICGDSAKSVAVRAAVMAKCDMATTNPIAAAAIVGEKREKKADAEFKTLAQTRKALVKQCDTLPSAKLALAEFDKLHPELTIAS